MVRRRRIIRRLTIAVFCFALCATGIWALPKIIRFLTLKSGDYTYVILSDGTAEIRQYYGKDTSLTIPEMLDSHPVSRIGDKAFCWRILLRDVTVPKNILSIGKGAFMGCSHLSTVTLSEGLNVIDDHAFSGCSSLSDILIPESVTTIGSNAFGDCLSLRKIRIPDSVTSVGSNPFNNCPSLHTILFSPDHPVLMTQDGNLLDRSGTVLIRGAMTSTSPDQTIPDGTCIIGESAYAQYSHLTGIQIPEGVSAIQDHAFSQCTNLETLCLPSTVSSIGNDAFSECTTLKEIELPRGLSSIGYLAFYGCDSLSRISIPASVTFIGKGAFIGCRNLTIYVEPDSYAEMYCIRNELPFKSISGLF